MKDSYATRPLLFFPHNSAIFDVCTLQFSTLKDPDNKCVRSVCQPSDNSASGYFQTSVRQTTVPCCPTVPQIAKLLVNTARRHALNTLCTMKTWHYVLWL